MLSEALEKVLQSFQNAEALQAHAVRELQDAFLDSREPGWDGYGANAVPDEAFLRAKTFLDQHCACQPNGPQKILRMFYGPDPQREHTSRLLPGNPTVPGLG
jgi:hypothetical protein